MHDDYDDARNNTILWTKVFVTHTEIHVALKVWCWTSILGRLKFEKLVPEKFIANFCAGDCNGVYAKAYNALKEVGPVLANGSSYMS